MSIKNAIKRRVANHLFSIERRDAQRKKAEDKRQREGASHTVYYYHEVGDPYSCLMVQLLDDFAQSYDVDILVRLVPPPFDWAAPEREALEAYGRHDAERLAEKAGLWFVDPGKQPSAAEVSSATSRLAQMIDDGSFLSGAAGAEKALWRSSEAVSSETSSADLGITLEANAKERDSLGHYLGGTLYYAGEWYWGPDRLHYLERRLTELGAKTSALKEPCLFPPPVLLTTPSQKLVSPPDIHWYLSFRSPYTAIVYTRVKALADAYGASLKLRYVLPMVMRNLPVPRKKGTYIMSDVVREAHRMDIPFGDFSDPVGKPVERGYAILAGAIERGRGFEFAQSFLEGVWSQGIDAGTDKGLEQLVVRAGLDWSEMKLLLGTDNWQETAEANRIEMMEYDLWGVPSFRVGEVATWGQDRLWVIEDHLAQANDMGAAK